MDAIKPQKFNVVIQDEVGCLGTIVKKVKIKAHPHHRAFEIFELIIGTLSASQQEAYQKSTKPFHHFLAVPPSHGVYVEMPGQTVATPRGLKPRFALANSVRMGQLSDDIEATLLFSVRNHSRLLAGQLITSGELLRIPLKS